jgi:hypothetical protein
MGNLKYLSRGQIKCFACFGAPYLHYNEDDVMAIFLGQRLEKR